MCPKAHSIYQISTCVYHYALASSAFEKNLVRVPDCRGQGFENCTNRFKSHRAEEGFLL